MKIVPFWCRSAAVIVAAASATLAVGCTGPARSLPRPAPTPSGKRLAVVPRRDRAGIVWLCRPGLVADPCAGGLSTTVVAGDGHRAVKLAAASGSSHFDCFYVYPTVSSESTVNADLAVQPAEVSVAMGQAARFSQVCDVWAPMYRQITVDGLGRAYLDPAPGKIAYASVLSAWKDFIAHYDNGRPVIFIGHSQGSSMLIRLLRAEVDPNPVLLRRTVVAILAGGNVTVPTGRTEGATFRHLPLCASRRQTGCVIAYSSFPAQPPASSNFGRPGQGVSIYSGQTATTGVQVACVNPAAPGGGTAGLVPYYPVTLAGGWASMLPYPAVATSWVAYPQMYSATCRSTGGATWLEVRDIGPARDLRPRLTQALGATWGYHLADINLALGNLVADVRSAEAAYEEQR